MNIFWKEGECCIFLYFKDAQQRESTEYGAHHISSSHWQLQSLWLKKNKNDITTIELPQESVIFLAPWKACQTDVLFKKLMDLKRSCRLGIKTKSILKYSNCPDLKSAFHCRKSNPLALGIICNFSDATQLRESAAYTVLYSGKGGLL